MPAKILTFPVIPGGVGNVSHVSNIGMPPQTSYKVATPGRDADMELDALVARMQQRDEAALADLYNRAVATVYALAVRILGIRADAEEVTVDVFSQAWDRAADFDAGRGSVMAWLITICRTRAIDQLRRRARRHSVHEQFAAEPVAGDVADSPEDLLEVVETGSRVHGALRELSTERRQVLSLAYLRGLTHEEIAVFTRLPLGTVKSHIRRGLGELREHLGAEPK
jgi:RNA polymerase sigma-70 factor (ECF subfamily)